jgi:hypothetical protein
MFVTFVGNINGRKVIINTDCIEDIIERDVPESDPDRWEVRLGSKNSHYLAQEEFERLERAIQSEPSKPNKTRYQILHEQKENPNE